MTCVKCGRAARWDGTDSKKMREHHCGRKDNNHDAYVENIVGLVGWVHKAKASHEAIVFPDQLAIV